MSNRECVRCARAANNAYLCSTCVEGLRRHLRDLPWWLDRLSETALGDVKMGDGGRTYRRETIQLARYTDEADGNSQLESDILAGKLTQAKLLASGGVNARASNEYQRIHNTLTHYVQDLCETRGIESPRLTQASGMARWLAKHASAVAQQDNARRCCEDIEHVMRTVERIINRPVPPRFIGPCPTDPAPEEVLRRRGKKGDKTSRCNQELTADHKAQQVTCSQCATTQDIDAVMAQNFAESGDKLLTVRELVDWVLPRLDEPVPQRTLEQWIKRGWVETRGKNEQGHQMVRLDDVRECRRQRPRHANKAS